MLSIAMTAFNGEKYIRKQIESILNQTYEDFELVICDDCSSDKTVEIINEFVNKDNRVHLYCNDTNMGFVKNFEKAIMNCVGDYIALCDQDDIWTSNHLKILLESIGNKDLCCADAILFNDEETICKLKMSDTLTCDFIPQTEEDMFFYLLFNNFVQGASCLFSSKLVKKILPFIDNVYHDHWIALNAICNNGIVYINNCILLYRQHESQVTVNKKQTLFSLINRSKNNKKTLSFENLKKLKEIVPSKYEYMYKLGCKYYSRKQSFLGRILNIPFLVKNYKRMYSVYTYKYLVLRLIKSLFWS